MQLVGRTILITGGTSGIGLELAKRLLASKNTVLLTGRDASKLRAAEKSMPGIRTFVSDVSDPNAIKSLYDVVSRDFPMLNVLINNAGVMREINLHTVADIAELTSEITTNLCGPIRMSAQFLPLLKQQESAAIVNVSSGLAFVPLPISPVYCATKAGLHSFTQSLREQLRNTKIKVYELAPPATQTPMLGDFHNETMKGIAVMSVETLVEATIRGIEQGRLEIRPGQSNQLKLMSRIAPDFIGKQLGRTVDQMLKRPATESSR